MNNDVSFIEAGALGEITGIGQHGTRYFAAVFRFLRLAVRCLAEQPAQSKEVS